MDDSLSLPHADLTVLVANRGDVEELRQAASKFHLFGTSLTKRFTCQIKAVNSESVIKVQLDATSKAYDPARLDGTRGSLLDGLLFDGTQRHKRVDPTTV